MKKLVVVLFLVILPLYATTVIAGGSQQPPLVSYPVSGSPRHVAVESPGRLWFTLPEENSIGRLVVTSDVEFDVVTYTAVLIEPYDIAFTGGSVWFTSVGSGAIGRLDPTDGAVVAFPIPSMGSQPVALDVLSGTPTQVWFADQANDALGQLVVTSTVDYAFHEYPLPVDKFGGTPQISDVDIANSDRIWFSAPGAQSIGSFRPSYWPWHASAFTPVSDPAGITPQSISVDAQGYPWFTDVVGNRLGKFFPQTIALFDFYPVSTPASGLYDLVAAQGSIWFSESVAGRVGRLNTRTRQVQEYHVPGSQPLGIDIDSNGCVWIADGGTDSILEWCSPYFHRVLLPLVMKGQGQAVQ